MKSVTVTPVLNWLRKSLLYGLTPPVLIFTVCFLIKGWFFLGHCDGGDGVVCTAKGILGYLEFQTGFPDYDPWSQSMSVIFGAILSLVLIIWSGLLGALYDRGTFGRKLFLGLQCLSVTVIIIAFLAIGDKRIFNLNGKGYLSSDSAHNYHEDG